MNRVIRICFLASLACMMLVAAGCATKTAETPAPESLVDTGLPTLNGEALRAADEITAGIVYFAFDKFNLSDESKQLLARKAELMKRYPQIKVSVQGNCDDRGTEEYNLALGERRARASSEFLIMSGVAATQMEVISYGKLRPAVQGNNEAAWAKNRRDDFVVLNPRGKY